MFQSRVHYAAGLWAILTCTAWAGQAVLHMEIGDPARQGREVELRDDEGQPIKTVQASYANFVWGLPKAHDTVYPTLGVSLMGKLGDRPTQLIQVSKGSVADRAGLVVGDVLLSIDGRPVDSAETLRIAFAPVRWGNVVTVVIERGGKKQELELPIRRNAADQ